MLENNLASFPTAKIAVPQPRALIRRERLVAPIGGACAGGRVGPVVAPGGSGKTSLLADWAHHATMHVAWYALDSADRDTRRLVSGLLVAVERVLPGTTAPARAMLSQGAADIAVLGMLLGVL